MQDVPGVMEEGTGFRGETAADLVYDDDPIEGILYGRAPEPATQASIFAPARRFLAELKSGENATDLNAVLSKCRRFLDDENPLTPELFSTLFEIVRLAAGSETLPETAEIGEAKEVLVSLYRAAGMHRPEITKL